MYTIYIVYILYTYIIYCMYVYMYNKFLRNTDALKYAFERIRIDIRIYRLNVYFKYRIYF